MSERDDTRRLLRELLDEVLTAPANGNGHAQNPPAPQVPAPPVAAVLRPSTWSQPPAPGEVIGDAPAADATPPRAGDAGTSAAGGAPAAAAAQAAAGEARADAAGLAPHAGRVEAVTLDSDADLDRFVRALVARFENPRDRMAVKSGALRFTLRRAAAPGSPGAVHRIERGAVTERAVNAAAQAGARLVLAPGAVLTPLARERARALKIEIERERRC